MITESILKHADALKNANQNAEQIASKLETDGVPSDDAKLVAYVVFNPPQKLPKVNGKSLFIENIKPDGQKTIVFTTVAVSLLSQRASVGVDMSQPLSVLATQYDKIKFMFIGSLGATEAQFEEAWENYTRDISGWTEVLYAEAINNYYYGDYYQFNKHYKQVRLGILGFIIFAIIFGVIYYFNS